MAESRGWYSRGYLPHFDSPERIQHVVFRTADSLPAHLQPGGLDVRRFSEMLDGLLDLGAGACPLSGSSAAATVENALLHFDGERYRLLSWCVMPNHVHALLEQIEGARLADIVKSWKAYTAAQINKESGAAGRFWARDYFDRFMRDEAHLAATVAYIEDNPVKAGLCDEPWEWRFSSARRRLTDGKL